MLWVLHIYNETAWFTGLREKTGFKGININVVTGNTVKGLWKRRKWNLHCCHYTDIAFNKILSSTAKCPQTNATRMHVSKPLTAPWIARDDFSLLISRLLFNFVETSTFGFFHKLLAARFHCQLCSYFTRWRALSRPTASLTRDFWSRWINK